MKKLSGYAKIVAILFRIYLLLFLQNVTLALKRRGHGLIESS